MYKTSGSCKALPVSYQPCHSSSPTFAHKKSFILKRDEWHLEQTLNWKIHYCV